VAKKMPPNWVRDPDYDLPRLVVEHRDGVPARSASRPRWWHRHFAQTRTLSPEGTVTTQHCPCGAVCYDGEHWFAG
jgi:hypothetical protein